MADRSPDALAIQALCAAYARAVDARDYAALGELFSDDALLSAHRGEPGRGPKLFELRGRARILKALPSIERFRATTHLVSLPVTHIDGDIARNEVSCLAHHLYDRQSQARLYVMAIRYRDRCRREAGTWRFSERCLVVDWEEDRAFHAGAPPPEGS
jgi:ketosteroid isomerase-like protein